MCSIEIANQTIHQKTCILLCMEVYDYYFHCKEYAVTTHRNVWYFYRYHPMSSNGIRGLALPAYFELLPWGTFPVFTQRASCHFITRRFTYFYRTRSGELFPGFTQTCFRFNTHRFSDSLSPGNFFPQLLAYGAPSGVAIFA